MKYLFVHQNFPGQFLHLVRHLVEARAHDIVFITEENRNHIEGVRKVPYARPRPPSPEVHWTVREFDGAMRRAEAVADTARQLKRLGYEPDIVIGHHGWGELLNLTDVWPGVPLLGYMEFFYHTHDYDVGFDPEFKSAPGDFPRIRAKNAVNLQALQLEAHGQTPTRWQLSTYPEWARPGITVLPEGVNLDVCKPNPALRRKPVRIGEWEIGPKDKLVTYVARDLEPYRGAHVMIRALPHLLKRRDVRVVMVGGDGVSYGAAPEGTTWRKMFMAELGAGFDASRVLFPGRVDYNTYLRLLQRSDVHVYLTYPFVASWSLREALATGCAVIGSDTPPVAEFVSHGRNGMLASFFDPKRLAETALELIENTVLSQRLRAGARRYAEAELAMPDYLAAYEALIGSLVEKAGAETAARAASPPEPPRAKVAAGRRRR